MAKVGEGDARWIVEERADGANVNAWHWAERDVLPWAKRRLQELLGETRTALPLQSCTQVVTAGGGATVARLVRHR